MERRLVAALILTALVVVLVPMLFPARSPDLSGEKKLPDRRMERSHDSVAVYSEAPRLPEALPDRAIGERLQSDTVVVHTGKVRYQLTTVGAVPAIVTLDEYRALTGEGGRLRLTREGIPLLKYSVVAGVDTLSLDTISFRVDTITRVSNKGTDLYFSGNLRSGEVRIMYAFGPDDYTVQIAGSVHGIANASELLIVMPEGLRSQEADTLDDQRYLSYAFKPTTGVARSVSFSKLDPGQHRRETGPFTWVVSKNKYFLVALLTPRESSVPFSSAMISAPAQPGRMAKAADIILPRPIVDGSFQFELYAGPQEWRRLRALGRDMEYANPYGGFMRRFVQPFATIVMRALLWMHDVLEMSYGWVLVVFGVVVRLILWPLNQGAMRTSLKMQRVQPEILAIQKKYKENPQKQQAEMLRIYKEHNMSPFSMFSGCLPMLLPMPVLFALFFVFQNTIEFRGVPFLWLSDISLKDPYYILPLLMGASMYLLSWIGMRNSPPNPQAKMMGYVFPVVMTVALLNLASGLNLYYAVQNIAALPQQWFIARERAKVAKQ